MRNNGNRRVACPRSGLVSRGGREAVVTAVNICAVSPGFYVDRCGEAAAVRADSKRSGLVDAILVVKVIESPDERAAGLLRNSTTEGYRNTATALWLGGQMLAGVTLSVTLGGKAQGGITVIMTPDHGPKWLIAPVPIPVCALART